MKNLHLIVWLTQLGLSIAVPLAGFVWLAVWLRERFGLGIWVIFVGIGLGLFCAVDGFCKNLKLLNRLGKDEKKKDAPLSFDEHA